MVAALSIVDLSVTSKFGCNELIASSTTCTVSLHKRRFVKHGPVTHSSFRCTGQSLGPGSMPSFPAELRAPCQDPTQNGLLLSELGWEKILVSVFWYPILLDISIGHTDTIPFSRSPLGHLLPGLGNPAYLEKGPCSVCTWMELSPKVYFSLSLILRTSKFQHGGEGFPPPPPPPERPSPLTTRQACLIIWTST